jgi:beta-galactosidase/beta-glucuronidase
MRCWAAALLCWYARAEDPIGADAITYLDDGHWSWVRADDGFTIPASVPGDVVTDLERAGVIEDPLLDDNFIRDAPTWNRTWTLRTSFRVDSDAARIALIFDGVKMGASVKLNHVTLGTIRDQFLRYAFDVRNASRDLLRETNKLELIFDPSIDVGGRFAACSGGWDWAPYVSDDQGRAFTRGPWKSVYLAESQTGVFVTHLVPRITYRGAYPTEPLADGDFDVAVKLHIDADRPASLQVTARGNWSADASTITVAVAPGETALALSLQRASNVALWRPNGLGARAFYEVSVDTNSITTKRRVAFRTVAVVTGDDTDPAYVEKSENASGTASHGLFLRVNGAAVWARGANVVPTEILEGRDTAERQQRLVASAAAAGFNTLRVWGGGVFLPKAFYDACDDHGLLVYHDLMFAQSGHAPRGTIIERDEIRHQVRRLSSHPSLFLWSGCNECTDLSIYVDLLGVIAAEDPSKAIWPASPSNGWVSGVARLWATPDGTPLEARDPGAIEAHGPYIRGGGFAAVNGVTSYEPVATDVRFDEAPVGLSYKSSFVSEFGAVAWASPESLASTLSPRYRSLFGNQPPDVCAGDGFPNACEGSNVLARRNYPCANFVGSFFGRSEDYLRPGSTPPALVAYLNTSQHFASSLYLCGLASALLVKNLVEAHRSRNELGHLVWQLNEVWPTGGWGSLEYGGRWKPHHYWYAKSLFRDVVAACDRTGRCYVRNDRSHRPFAGTVTIDSVDVATGRAARLLTRRVTLAPGPAVVERFSAPLGAVDATRTLCLIRCFDDAGAVVSSSELILARPVDLRLPAAQIKYKVRGRDVALETNATALFVVLTTLSEGRFADNAFSLLPGRKTLEFLPFGAFDAGLFASSLRVEHLGERVGLF